jgi:pimeloyl-ACP methyl ester carboxylesterase
LKPTICFSHANSFPAGTYTLLFDAWRRAGWQVIALPRFGHDPAFPVTRDWPHLLEQLAQFITQHSPGQPVHLVGHSLGGFLSLMLACQRRELAAQVVLLDSPVIGGWRSHGAAAARGLGLYHRIGGAYIAQQRRHQWPSRSAALAHFAAKPAFARWDARVLGHYIACGTEADTEQDGTGDSGAVRLSFRREVEAAIYNTLPLRMGRMLGQHAPAAAVHFIGGSRSTELRRAGMDATRALLGQRLHWIDGTHLFPMERPEETAAAVLRCLHG